MGQRAVMSRVLVTTQSAHWRISALLMWVVYYHASMAELLDRTLGERHIEGGPA